MQKKLNVYKMESFSLTFIIVRKHPSSLLNDQGLAFFFFPTFDLQQIYLDGNQNYIQMHRISISDLFIVNGQNLCRLEGKNSLL